jgi:hypothetical protein
VFCGEGTLNLLILQEIILQEKKRGAYIFFTKKNLNSFHKILQGDPLDLHRASTESMNSASSTAGRVTIPDGSAMEAGMPEMRASQIPADFRASVEKLGVGDMPMEGTESNLSRLINDMGLS